MRRRLRKAMSGPRRELGVALIAPLVLLLVAGVGTYRFATIDHVSWRTLAFGMFSRVDDHPTRIAVGRTTIDGQPMTLRPPADLRDLADSAKVAPTEARLDRLARAWLTEDDRFDELEIEVLGMHFEASTGEVSLRSIASHRRERPQ